MNRNLLLTAAVAGMFVLAGCSDKPVAPLQLPQPVQAFVKQYFPAQNITYAEKDWGLFGTDYDVILADGTKITIASDGEWDKIESKLNAVPPQLVPPAIDAFTKANYPSVPIVKVDKERYGYEVELANDLDLKFNQQGALIEMDD